MTLVYDNIIFSLQKFGGISTYWYELITRLQQEADINLRYIEAGTSENIMRDQLKLKTENISNLKRGGILLERFLKIPDKLIPGNAIFHSSYFRNPGSGPKVKQVVTIHDLTHNMFYGKLRSALHNYTKNAAIRDSELIIAVSENTKKDIIRFHPKITPDKIKVIYNGASGAYRKLEGLPKYKGRPFILYIGSREPYKNFPFAVEVVSRMPEFQLVIISSPFNQNEENKLKEKLGSRYKIFSGISNDRLNVLYNQAFCLFYPSSYEGFGIPLLEAMKAGCPIVAHNTSSIPEVAGNGAILFDELNMEAAIHAINQVAQQRNILVSNGLKQSAKFSWDVCYRETLSAYRSINDIP